MADLTRQLKELKEMPAGANPNEPNALITQENEMLRNTIMRQLRLQNRQQQAKELIIAQLSKMENASTDLLKQVEELSKKENGLTGVPTGFTDLDRLTSGWQPGDGPCYECYLNDPQQHPEGKHIVEIRMSVKPL